MRALMISNDSLLHAEVAAQGSARLPAVQLVACLLYTSPSPRDS